MNLEIIFYYRDMVMRVNEGMYLGNVCRPDGRNKKCGKTFWLPYLGKRQFGRSWNNEMVCKATAVFGVEASVLTDLLN
jgi:hypothetical protein